MSNWIIVKNLPYYFDKLGLRNLFRDVGHMERVFIHKDHVVRTATGFIAFSVPKHARTAASS